MFIIKGTKLLRHGMKVVSSYWNGNSFGCRWLARVFQNKEEAEVELRCLQEKVPAHMSIHTWAETYTIVIIECPTE